MRNSTRVANLYTVIAMARPWLVSAVAGAVVPLLLLTVYAQNPELQEGLRKALVLTWPFSCRVSLEGPPAWWTWSSGLVYWGLGALFSVGALRQHFSAPFRIATALLSAALASLIFTLPLLATIWALAIGGGQAGGWTSWGLLQGNHGPWRQLCPLRQLLGITLLVPAFGAALGMVAFFVRASLAALVITVTCILTVIAIFVTHHWLID